MSVEEPQYSYELDESDEELIEDIVRTATGYDGDIHDDLYFRVEDAPDDEEAIDAESLEIVDMAEQVEFELDVHVPDDELQSIVNVGLMKEYVSENR